MVTITAREGEGSNSNLEISRSDEETISRLSALCMISIVIISSAALLGWVTGRLLIAQGSAQFLPMAPGTALVFLSLSLCWAAYRGKSVWSQLRRIAGVGIILVTLTCILLLLESLGILRTGIETFLVPNPTMLGLVPTGRMSPITAFALFLACFSLLLTIHPSTIRSLRLSSVLGVAVAFVGFVIVVGYLFGEPLLYGSTIIPVALTTGIALVPLGIGLSFSSGPATWPANRVFGSSIQVRLFRPFFFLTLAITLFFGWYSAQDIPLHPALASALVLFVSLTIFSVVVSGISETLAGRITRGEMAMRELAAIVKSSDDAIIGKTLEGVITSWNQGAEKLYGYSAEEVIGRSISILIPPDHPNELQEILDQVRKGEPLPQFDTQRLRRDSTLVNVSLTVSPIKDSAGRTVQASIVTRDITERIRMEKKLSLYAEQLEELVDERTTKLAESENRIRLITDSLPALISYLDVELNYRFANKAYEEWFGKPSSEIIGQSFRGVVGDSAYPRVISHLNAALSGEVQSFDYELAHRSLGKRVVTARYVPDFGSNHQVQGVFVLGIDVTDRKRAENALQESEKKYRELFEASPVALFEEDFSALKKRIIELRKTGIVNFREYLANHPEEINRCAAMVKVVNVNNATLELYRAKDVKDFVNGLSTVITDDSVKTFGEELIAFAEGKTAFTSEIINVSLRGEIRHVNVICTVIPGYEDTLAKVLVSVIDLTPQRELEQELRSAKERLEYVIDSNPAIIYLAKPLPDQSDYYAVYQSRRSTVSITGFEPDKFVGEGGIAFWESRVHPDDLESYKAGASDVWSKGYRAYEYRFMHKDGTYRWIREEANVIRDSAGNIQDIIGFWTDVTGRKRMEEQLLRSNRLAAIGETAAMVGHDLRNPLQGITGALSLLRDESLTKEERNEMFQLIQNSIEYADAIVSDLLDYAAEIHLTPEVTTPRSITRESVAALTVPHNITIENVSEDNPKVIVDSKRMKRVFTNLIKNAIDAMPEGGKITIASNQSKYAAEITIRDTGPGMPASVTEDIWKPFQTTKAKGLGLGLAICKRLVDAHGGNISLSSRIGEGTTVTLHLPIEPTEGVNKN